MYPIKLDILSHRMFYMYVRIDVPNMVTTVGQGLLKILYSARQSPPSPVLSFGLI